MMQMIGYEFGKIFHKKIVYAALIFVWVMATVMYVERGGGTELALGADGTYLEGREALAYDKEVAARYAGSLTEEKVQEILEEFAPAAPDAAFWLVNQTYDTIATFWAESDGSFNGLSVREAFPPYEDEQDLVWDYNKGWISFLELGMYTMAMFMGFLLIIALSPVFSEEYTRGTDALILTSRHGKWKCAWAKIIASYLFTLLCVGVFLVVSAVVLFLDYGMTGAGSSVQLNSHWLLIDTPYFLPCVQAAGYAILLWLSGSLILTAVTLLISALCRSSFLTVVIGIAAYLIPTLFGQMKIPREILSLNPIWCFLTEQPMMVPKLFGTGGGGISYVWVIVAFALVLTGISFVLTRRFFARHQVVSG